MIYSVIYFLIILLKRSLNFDTYGFVTTTYCSLTSLTGHSKNNVLICILPVSIHVAYNANSNGL